MMRTGDISKILSKEWSTMDMVRLPFPPSGDLQVHSLFQVRQEILS